MIVARDLGPARRVKSAVASRAVLDSLSSSWHSSAWPAITQLQGVTCICSKPRFESAQSQSSAAALHGRQIKWGRQIVSETILEVMTSSSHVGRDCT